MALFRLKLQKLRVTQGKHQGQFLVKTAALASYVLYCLLRSKLLCRQCCAWAFLVVQPSTFRFPKRGFYQQVHFLVVICAQSAPRFIDFLAILFVYPVLHSLSLLSQASCWEDCVWKEAVVVPWSEGCGGRADVVHKLPPCTLFISWFIYPSYKVASSAIPLLNHLRLTFLFKKPPVRVHSHSIILHYACSSIHIQQMIFLI